MNDKEQLEGIKDRGFIEHLKNHSTFEHMREEFIVPKETYLRLVEMDENFVELNSQYDTCIKIQEELIEEKQQNSRYRGALEKIRAVKYGEYLNCYAYMILEIIEWAEEALEESE